MSTRSQIQMVTKNVDGEIFEKAQIYRHSDGYPQGVIADLKRLFKIQDETKSYRGAGYTLANFIFLQKLDSLNYYLDDSNDLVNTEGVDALDVDTFTDLDQPFTFLGYGVENVGNGIHGDEEYLYRIIETMKDTPGGTPLWVVKISDDFPTWDDDGVDRAFELANWKYRGEITEAYEKFVENSEGYGGDLL